MTAVETAARATVGRLARVTPEDHPFLRRPAWVLEANPDVIMRVKRLFPRADPDRRGRIAITDTPDVARDLRDMVLNRWPLDIDDEHRRTLDESADLHARREEIVTRVLAGTPTLLGGLHTPCCEERTYQVAAADLALQTGRLLIGDDLGLGKTITGLLTLRDPEKLPALIVCQTHLQRQWLRELHTVLPWLRGHLIRTRTVYEPRRRREMRGYDPDVLIMSYAKLDGWADHLAGTVRTVIFDEMQELRNPAYKRGEPTALKYIAAAQVADRADLVVGLTATPVYNYGGEIFNLMQILAPDALGDRHEFAREWCGGQWSDKAKVEDPAALGSWLRQQGLFLRRTKADVGRELPDEPMRIPHTVDCDQRVLEDILAGAADLARVILDEKSDRKQAFVAASELDMQMRKATGVAKAPYVAEFVKLLLEAEGKVVLFGWHRDVYDIWLDRLADHHPVLYTGSESAAGKERAKAQFVGGEQLAEINRHRPLDDKLPESDVLIISLRSGAGLDGLQHVCRVCVFGELDWSPAVHDQCIGRVARDGQQGQVLAYFLNTEDGADPVMVDVLNLKRQQQEPLRDPDAPAFEEQVDTRERVRMLAQQILDRRAGRGRKAAA